MRTSRTGLAVTLLAAGIALLPLRARAADDAAAPSRVSYVTSTSVYLETGADGGLAMGDQLDVLRDEQVVARLEVIEVTASRARCARLGAGTELAAGDEVRRAADSPPAAAPAAASAAAPSAQAAAPSATPPAEPAKKPFMDRLRAAGLKGRIGFRYLAVQWLDGEGGYRQPALDFRLNGTQVAGAPIDVDVDIRSRRTTRTFAGGGSETRNRLYRMAISYRDGGKPLRVTLGRQFSPSLAVVSLFDGLSAEYRKGRWGAGLFTGTQPDPSTYAYSSEVREVGGYYEYGARPDAPHRWVVTAGLIGSYDEGEIDREFAFFQQRFDGPRLSVYAAEEVDLNRGWKKDSEGETFSITSAFASLHYRVTDAISLQGGFDDRRNVRLYRDSLTPETEFDDRYRQGYWAGFDGKAGSHVRYGVEGRQSDGGTAGRSDAYTFRAGVHGFGGRGFGAHLRSTRYTSDAVEGWLHTLSASADLTAWSRIEIHAGTRSETALSTAIPTGRLNWYGIDWDSIFGRRFLLTISVESNRGASESTNLFYTTLSYRF